MDGFHRLVLQLTVFGIPVLLAISFHEAAHGYVARFLGDPTAARAGRISLNPLRHIDPVGTVLLPLVAWWLIDLPFGYARPVPVDFNQLGQPRRDTALVAFAGPVANLLMGAAWTLSGWSLHGLGVQSPFCDKVAQAGILVNAAMFVFNMIPVPPLDGGEILMSLLPRKLVRSWNRMPLTPGNPRQRLREMRRILPRRLVSKLAQLELYDLVVFGVFLILMKFHVLDNHLLAAINFVTAVMSFLVSPFYPLLS